MDPPSGKHWPTGLLRAAICWHKSKKSQGHSKEGFWGQDSGASCCCQIHYLLSLFFLFFPQNAPLFSLPTHALPSSSSLAKCWLQQWPGSMQQWLSVSAAIRCPLVLPEHSLQQYRKPIGLYQLYLGNLLFIDY